jgi:hypothetical protein
MRSAGMGSGGRLAPAPSELKRAEEPGSDHGKDYPENAGRRKRDALSGLAASDRVCLRGQKKTPPKRGFSFLRQRRA